MDSKASRTFVAELERIYGKYTPDSVRDDVIMWVAEKVDPSFASVGHLMLAVKENHPIRFGPPDMASISSAVRQYEKDNGPCIKKRLMEYSTYKSEPPPDPEEARRDREVIRKWLAADGFDIDKPYAITAWVMWKVKKDHEERTNTGAFARGEV